MDESCDGSERRKTQLREAAEARLAGVGSTEADRPVAELLHELQVHQIELEMQNESLRQAQVELETSRDRYVDLYEFAPVGYLTLTREGLIAETNLTGAALLGEVRKQLPQRRFEHYVTPEDRERWRRLFISAMSNEARRHCELALLRDDGTRFQAHLDCLRMAHANDPPTLRMVLTDISDQVLREAQVKHLNRVLRTISACNEDLVRARGEADLLGDICRDIVEIGSYLLAWVAEADPTFPGASTPIAWAGDETSYLVHARLDHDPDHLRYCLVSAALGSQRSQVCNRLNATPECAFGELSELGAQSVLSLPLQNDGRLYGALTIFSTQSDAF